MIVYSAPTVVISYDSGKALLCQKWEGFSSSEILRKAMNASFEFMVKENIHLILSDIRKQKVVAPREQEYTKNLALKFFQERKKLKVAIVGQFNSVVMACARRYDRSLSGEIDAEVNRFFEDIDEALSWLTRKMDQHDMGNN
jgi:Leu/Phe-tRNA-protein transferase